MGFIEGVSEKLRRHPKRIVFPDGELPRVIRAASLFYQRELGVPILLGRRNVIENIATHEGIALDRVGIIDPQHSDELPAFQRRLERLERYRRHGIGDSREVMVKPNHFAAMMVQYGLADAIVGGAGASGGSLLRPMLLMVKKLPHADVISASTILEIPGRPGIGDDGVVFLADTGIVPEPSMEQLATIAVQTGLLARQVFGRRPRIAMLSFSTKGSARTQATSKVSGAVELARILAEKVGAEMSIDGEMQADAALDPGIAAIKMGESRVAGHANVLVFPNLDSGNIALKLLQLASDCTTYGQIIQGFTRPAADLSRGASAEAIAAMAAVVGLQAIEYRKIHPEEPEPAE